MMEIKKHTSNDLVRAALAILSDDLDDAKSWGKAASLEMHYHSNCLRDAHRTCKNQESRIKNFISPRSDLCTNKNWEKYDKQQYTNLHTIT